MGGKRGQPRGNAYRSTVMRGEGGRGEGARMVDVTAARRRAFDERMNVIADAVKQDQLDESWLIDRLRDAHHVLSPSMNKEDLMQAVDADRLVWKAAHLTRKLNRQEDMRLMVALPMSCDVDSWDVERWVAQEWGKDVTSGNLDEVISAFRKYYCVGVGPLRG